MEQIISKELLSEVLSEKICIEDTRPYMQYNNLCYDIYENKILTKSINIYELVHRCKEWALSKGYILMSKPRTSSSFATCVFCKNGKCDYEDDLWDDFRADTEPEAIFKACEWILNQKDSHAN